jgi:hypothetical protein
MRVRARAPLSVIVLSVASIAAAGLLGAGASRAAGTSTPTEASNCPPAFEEAVNLTPLVPGTEEFPVGTAKREGNAEVLRLQIHYGFAVDPAAASITECTQPRVTARAYRGTDGAVDLPVGRLAAGNGSQPQPAKAIRLKEKNLCRIGVPKALETAKAVRSSNCAQALLGLSVANEGSAVGTAVRPQACVIVQITRIRNSQTLHAHRETIPVSVEVERSFGGANSTGYEAADLIVKIGDPSVVEPHLVEPEDPEQSALCTGA